MTVLKTIVYLANSKKHGGTCFAGLELAGEVISGWIRPVSARSGHEVNTAEQTLPDGSTPQVLDVIEVGLIMPTPTSYQSENWLLEPQHHWRRVGRWSYEDAAAVADQPPTLWSNDSSSTVGINDRVAASQLDRHKRSIGLVRVERATVVVARNPWSGATEVRLHFHYRRAQHELKITDPVYYAACLGKGVGRYALSDRTLVTVSLAEPYTAPQPGAEAYSYKVVAAIIEPEGPPGGAK
jgi:hypothetical protein